MNSDAVSCTIGATNGGEDSIYSMGRGGLELLIHHVRRRKLKYSVLIVEDAEVNARIECGF